MNSEHRALGDSRTLHRVAVITGLAITIAGLSVWLVAQVVRLPLWSACPITAHPVFAGVALVALGFASRGRRAGWTLALLSLLALMQITSPAMRHRAGGEVWLSVYMFGLLVAWVLGAWAYREQLREDDTKTEEP